jgi:alkylhydroperoxidase family enzyme
MQSESCRTDGRGGGCHARGGKPASGRSTWRRCPTTLRETLEEQRKLYGAPLHPYLFYARNAAYFRAAKAMLAALQQETKRVPVTLRALLNRRVASWNGCEF